MGLKRGYVQLIKKGFKLSFRLKIHELEKERLVAICDENICGKNLIHNSVKLKIQERFYGQEIFSFEEALLEINKCTSLNAIGKEICELLVNHKIVHPAAVMWIDHEGNKIGHVILVK